MTQPEKSPGHQTIVAGAKEFIEQHWQEDLSLERIARHVFVSPFHFQKVFKSETGESPKEYLKRIRLENAIQRIRIDLHMTVYDVALECGFSSQAVFARAFRQKFGVSATEFRNLPFAEAAKLAAWEPSIQDVFQRQLLGKMNPAEMKRFRRSITLRRIEPLTVIYHATTMISEEHIGEEFQRLARRAGAHDIALDTTHCFGAMYDFPLHTPIERCRYRVCISVPGEATGNPKFSRMSVSGGKYGVFPVRGDFERAVRYCIVFFSDWLKTSHFQRSEHYYLEKFSTLPGPETYTKLPREIYVPLRPA